MTNDQGIREIADVDVVRAVEENNMDATHTCSKRDNAPGHDLVLAEESFISNVSAADSESYDNDGEDSAPPAVQQGWIVRNPGAAFWWRCIVNVARYYHCW